MCCAVCTPDLRSTAGTTVDLPSDRPPHLAQSRRPDLQVGRDPFDSSCSSAAPAAGCPAASSRRATALPTRASGRPACASHRSRARRRPLAGVPARRERRTGCFEGSIDGHRLPAIATGCASTAIASGPIRCRGRSRTDRTGPPRSSIPRRFQWTRRWLARASTRDRSGDLRAAHRHLHAGGHVGGGGASSFRRSRDSASRSSR